MQQRNSTNIRNNKSPIMAIVVPCYNEQLVIRKTSNKLLYILNNLIHLKKINSSSFIYFVDDGSIDDTWLLIQELHKMNKMVKGLKLSRNVGHQKALLAGLLNIKERVDCIISIDADLQQDEQVMPLFLEKYLNGAELVFGIRNDRSSDKFFKKYTALFFYNLMKIMGVDIIKNHADYRLISKKVLYAISEYQEVNIFLRGIFAEIGFKRDYVYFDVKKRVAGESQYTFKKMLSFAIEGITSFSIFPLRVITFIGFSVFIICVLMSIYVFIQSIVIGRTVPGWASTILPIYFIGGIQIFCLGVIGEYIGKIYKEAKARPHFIKDIEIF